MEPLTQPLKIPNAHEAPLRKLLSAGIPELEALAAHLNEPLNQIGTDPLNRVGKIFKLQVVEASELLSLLLNLKGLQGNLEVPMPNFVASLLRAAKKQFSIEVDPAREVSIVSLLDSHYLALACKAQDVAVDQERLFLSSQTYTEIRPVFSDDTDQMELEGMVVCHTLKVNYREMGERKTFFLSLEPPDLVELKRSLERAIKKQALLQATLSPPVPWVLRSEETYE